MVSLAEERSYETGMAFDQASREQVAAGLKKNYQRLYDLSQGEDNKFGLIPPSNGVAFDQFIMGLSDEVIEGRSDRSQHLRGLIQKLEPSEYQKLESISTIKESATEAVEANTGYFSFLGGSTIMNALAGLFKWVFSGFSGGFAGLKNIIAEGAVTNTITSFKNNLAERGIDPSTGLGQSVVAQFEQTARVKAGLEAPSDEPAFSLKSVAIEGLRAKTASTPTVSDEDIQAAPTKAMRDHFTIVAQNIDTEIATLIRAQADEDISPEDKQKYIDLISKAKPKMVEHAMELANPPTNALQDDFNERLVIATLRSAKADLDPIKDKVIADKIDYLTAELSQQGATLGGVMAASVEKGDKISAGLLATFKANLQEGQPTLLKIVQASSPNDPAVELAAHNAQIENERRRTNDAENLSASFANIIDQRLEEHITPQAIRKAIDEKITEELERKYPTDPAKNTPVEFTMFGYKTRVPGAQTVKARLNSVIGDNSVTRTVDNWSADEMPDPADRDKMASFTSDELKTIMREKLTEIMENPELQREFIVDGKLNKQKFNEVVIAEYQTRLEAEGKKDNGGRVGSFFARTKNQAMIVEGIRAELAVKITDDLAEEIGKGITEIQMLKGTPIITQAPSENKPEPEQAPARTEDVSLTTELQIDPKIEEKVRQLATSPFGAEGKKRTIAEGLMQDGGLTEEQANAAVEKFIATTTAKIDAESLNNPKQLAQTIVAELAVDQQLSQQMLDGVPTKPEYKDYPETLLKVGIQANLEGQVAAFLTTHKEELQSVVGAPKNEITMLTPGEYDQNFEGPGYTPAGAKPLQQPSQNIG